MITVTELITFCVGGHKKEFKKKKKEGHRMTVCVVVKCRQHDHFTPNMLIPAMSRSANCRLYYMFLCVCD